MTIHEAIVALRKNAETLERPQMQAALEKTRDELAKQAAEEFRNSHDPEGEPWIPSVRFRKEFSDFKSGNRLGFGVTLVETGALYMAVVSNIISATIGETHMSYPMFDGLPEYAATHEFGAVAEVFSRTFHANKGMAHVTEVSHGVRNIPARPFLGFGTETLMKAEEFGIETLNEQLLTPWR